MTRLEMQHKLATAIYASWIPARISVHPQGLAGPNGQQAVAVHIAPADDGMILQALVEAKLVLKKWEDNNTRANEIVAEILGHQAAEQRGDAPPPALRVEP